MRILVTVFASVWLLSVSIALATIINIPDDYPTIQEGIDASSDGDTVLVQPGAYVENINFNSHNAVLASLFLTTGDTNYISTTVIDGNRSGSVITFESGEDSTAQVAGFTIRNGYGRGNYPYFSAGGVTCWNQSTPRITDNFITANSSFFNGGGVFCLNSDPIISHNTLTQNSVPEEGGAICCHSSSPLICFNDIHGNEAYSGGGVHCSSWSSPVISGNTIAGNLVWTLGGGICSRGGSTPTISGNEIRGNTACWLGGALYCSDSNPTVMNNTIARNAAIGGGPFAGDGGGIYCCNSDATIINNSISGNWADEYGGGLYCVESSPTIVNTIFWNNAAVLGDKEIYLDSLCSPTVTYCNVEDTLWPGVGNISIDPLFRDPWNGDYHLQSMTSPDCGGPGDSPCIDVGDSTIIDTLISCDWGLGSIRSDMGAYGGGDSLQVGVDHQVSFLPDRFALLQNYPNPFNSTTIISYRLPMRSHVKLEIYNLLGQRVATLVNDREEAGHNSLIWDASRISSGLYFYKLTAGDHTETRRMILAK